MERLQKIKNELIMGFDFENDDMTDDFFDLLFQIHKMIEVELAS